MQKGSVKVSAGVDTPKAVFDGIQGSSISPPISIIGRSFMHI